MDGSEYEASSSDEETEEEGDEMEPVRRPFDNESRAGVRSQGHRAELV